MPRPVCVKCKLEFRRTKVGVVADIRARGLGSYEAYSADLFKCPDCGAEILAAFGAKPITRHTNASHKYTVGVAGAVKVYETVGHRIEEEGS